MKWMVASDLHGSEFYCEKLLNRFEMEKADKLLLLGDILYNGPRNDLPSGYGPKKVITELNVIKDKILCVKGNCDTEVDQAVLEFPMSECYSVISCEKNMIFATHGHRFNENNLPPLRNGDVLLHGHTHVPAYVVHQNYKYMNPGSVSIPKNGSYHGYMIIDNDRFVWKDLSGEVKRDVTL